MRKTTVLIVIVGLLLLAAGQPSSAYDNDTHYYLTYFLALKVGYTPAQAYRIASATVGIDFDSHTEPLQTRNVLVGPPRSAQNKRIRFHAFQDWDRFGEGFSDEGLADIRMREGGLWRRALEDGNPGPFLHFHQDTFAHKSEKYASQRGHAWDFHVPDFLSGDVLSAHAMARSTIAKLSEYMSACCRLQKPQPVNYERDVRPVVDALIAVNPALQLNERHYNTAQGLVEAYVAVPDADKAGEVIQRHLPEKLRVPPLSGRLAYPFDDYGRVGESHEDVYKLASTVTVRVKDQEDKPVDGAEVVLSLETAGATPQVQELAKESTKGGSRILLGVPVGANWVTVSHPDYETERAALAVSDHDHSVELRLLGVRFSVSATIKEEVPGKPEAEWPVYSGARVRLGGEVRETSALGTVTFTVEREGRYTLAALPREGDPGHKPATAEVSVAPARSDDPSVPPRRGASASVVLALPYQEPERRTEAPPAPPGRPGPGRSAEAPPAPPADVPSEPAPQGDPQCPALLAAARAALASNDNQQASSLLANLSSRCKHFPGLDRLAADIRAAELKAAQEAERRRQALIEQACARVEQELRDCRFGNARVIAQSLGDAACAQGMLGRIDAASAADARAVVVLQRALAAAKREELVRVLAELQQALNDAPHCRANEIQGAIESVKAELAALPAPETAKPPAWLTPSPPPNPDPSPSPVALSPDPSSSPVALSPDPSPRPPGEPGRSGTEGVPSWVGLENRPESGSTAPPAPSGAGAPPGWLSNSETASTGRRPEAALDEAQRQLDKQRDDEEERRRRLAEERARQQRELEAEQRITEERRRRAEQEAAIRRQALQEEQDARRRAQEEEDRIKRQADRQRRLEELGQRLGDAITNIAGAGRTPPPASDPTRPAAAPDAGDRPPQRRSPPDESQAPNRPPAEDPAKREKEIQGLKDSITRWQAGLDCLEEGVRKFPNHWQDCNGNWTMGSRDVAIAGLRENIRAAQNRLAALGIHFEPPRAVRSAPPAAPSSSAPRAAPPSSGEDAARRRREEHEVFVRQQRERIAGWRKSLACLEEGARKHPNAWLDCNGNWTMRARGTEIAHLRELIREAELSLDDNPGKRSR